MGAAGRSRTAGPPPPVLTAGLSSVAGIMVRASRDEVVAVAYGLGSNSIETTEGEDAVAWCLPTNAVRLLPRGAAAAVACSADDD